MAKLFFRYGAMNSGKTTALMQVAYNYEERGMQVLLLKPDTDTKGGDVVVSRLGIHRPVDHLISKDENIYSWVDSYTREERKIDCILVDESQFLQPEQVDQLFELVILRNIPVLCYGLRTDFRRQGFPGSTRLMLLAHSLEELKTICRCGRKALFNARKLNTRFIFTGGQVAIEGEDEITYESLCGNCYYEEWEKSKTPTLFDEAAANDIIEA